MNPTISAAPYGRRAVIFDWAGTWPAPMSATTATPVVTREHVDHGNPALDSFIDAAARRAGMRVLAIRDGQLMWHSPDQQGDLA
jgi:hypothetical protein